MNTHPLPESSDAGAELPGLIDRILEVFIPGRHTRKNLEKALGKGIGAAGDGTAGLLKEWLGRHERRQSVLRAQEDLKFAEIDAEKKIIEANTKARVKAIEAEAKTRTALYEVVTSSLGHIDKGLVDRAVLRIGSDLFDRQHAREQIAQQAIEQARFLPHSTSATNEDIEPPLAEEIDDDWLTEFWELAEKKSKPEIQAMFARILARECAIPGSFDPATLRTLSLLTKHSARAFEQICGICAFSPPQNVFIPLEALSPDGRISNDWTSRFGIVYTDFIHMSELGLISLGDAEISIDPGDIIHIGGNRIQILAGTRTFLTITPLTTSGSQLFEAIFPPQSDEVFEKFIQILEVRKVDYQLVPPGVPPQ